MLHWPKLLPLASLADTVVAVPHGSGSASRLAWRRDQLHRKWPDVPKSTIGGTAYSFGVAWRAPVSPPLQC